MKSALLNYLNPAGRETPSRSSFGDRQGHFAFLHGAGNHEGCEGGVTTASAQSSVTAAGQSTSGRGYRKSYEEMADALSAYLSGPSSYQTLFYVLDKLERLAMTNGRLPATAEIVAAQQKTDAAIAARLEAILVTAWNHGLIRVYPHDAIELTAGGKWLIKEGRSRRLALWSVNPKLDLAAICAIVHIEDGEGPIAEVPVGLLDVAPLRAVAKNEGDTTVTPSTIVRERGKPAKSICPVWQGLLAPARA